MRAGRRHAAAPLDNPDLGASRRADAELDAELRAFLVESIDATLASGMSRADAERAARIELGSPAAVKEWTRDVGWESRLESLWLDARYGVRSLRRSPGFTTIAVLTLGLGIGATTAIFAVVEAVILRPLPIAEPDRVFTLQQVDDSLRALPAMSNAARRDAPPARWSLFSAAGHQVAHLHRRTHILLDRHGATGGTS
jgi:hypothetical protein